MKQKIDVEFYTIWVATFHSNSSNSGYHKVESIAGYSEMELNAYIEEYLDNNIDMFLHSKKKQERIEFEWKKEHWDLVMRSEEY